MTDPAPADQKPSNNATPTASPQATRRPRTRIKRYINRRTLLIFYAALLIASLIVELAVKPDPFGMHAGPPEGAAELLIDTPAMRGDGPVQNAPPTTLSIHHYPAQPTADNTDNAPVLLMHGAPSLAGAADFEDLAPRLAATGRDVYAISRPGYGRSDDWAPSYSFKADARAALALMDELGIERAHLVGWSYAGAIILWMAEFAPERVASLGMLNAIGIQSGEGSGSYYFEHFKYVMGFPFVVAAPELIPDFGLAPSLAWRHAFIRDFWDSDQRPLRALMERLETPTIIIQGRHDFLVPASTAEEHHRIIGPSRLVMFDASHFFPVMPRDNEHPGAFERSTNALTSFIDRHDTPGTPVRRGVADFAPAPQTKPFTLFGYEIDLQRKWWVLIVLIALGTLISEDLTVIAVGLAVATGNLDLAVGLLGCLIGIVVGDYGLWAIGHFGGRRLLRIPPFSNLISERALDHWSLVFGKHTAKAVFLSRMLPGTRLPMYIAAGIIPGHNRKFLFWVTVAVTLWTPLLLVATLFIGAPLLGFFQDIFHGPWAIVAAFIVLFVILRIVSLEATELGRQRLKADIAIVRRVEFWPRWAFYLPLVPWLLLLAARFRSATVFTAANPGIEHGGGVINEEKHRIQTALEAANAPVLPALTLAPSKNADDRLATLKAAFADEHAPSDYPVVLKPDAGERGRSVRFVNNDDEARRYFETHHGTVQAQTVHDGPVEIGVLWCRVPKDGVPVDQLPGEIFSITRKDFPAVIGDGERTLEQLIWHHPRYRMQAKMFCRRFADRVDDVPAEGERVPLGRAGNHAQGCMFRDGADLATPELAQTIERIAQDFRDPDTGRRLDFGRFDIRAPSEDDIRAGTNLAIVELNGTLSESTNLYDPDRSVLWMYAVLFRQWARVYRLGALRRREGYKPLGVVGLSRELIGRGRSRRGPGGSD